MTKKQKDMYDTYKWAINKGAKTELYEVYGRFSKEKIVALNKCKKLQAELDGKEGTICTHNSYSFTYGFLFVDKESELLSLCYCTASNRYMFPII